MSAALFAGASQCAINVDWPPKRKQLPKGVRVWIDDRETFDFSVSPGGAVTVPVPNRSECKIEYVLPLVQGLRVNRREARWPPMPVGFADLRNFVDWGPTP